MEEKGKHVSYHKLSKRVEEKHLPNQKSPKEDYFSKLKRMLANPREPLE